MNEQTGQQMSVYRQWVSHIRCSDSEGTRSNRREY